jgi:O-antigen/teichoic acid export membrane protein
MSVRDTVARNTAFNAAGRFWEAAIGLVLTPYIVGHIGAAGWGLWAIVNVLTSYVSILDLGFGSGYAKYIAEHAGRNERREISAIVSTGLAAYLLIGGALVCLVWVAVDPAIGYALALIERFQPAAAAGAAEHAGLIAFLLRGSVVLYAASNLVSVFTSVQTGLQRMGLTNILSAAAALIKFGAMVYFLESGYGIPGLLYAHSVVLACFAAGSIGIAFHLVPDLRISPGHVSRAAFHRLFGFGWRTQVARLSNLMMFQADALIIWVYYGIVGGPSLSRVGVYRIGEELSTKVRQLPLLLLTALIPAFSDLDARGEEARLRRLYITASKYLAAVAVPLLSFTAASAGMLMHAWMGAGYETAAGVLRILCVGLIANVAPGVAIAVALGKGRADLHMKAGLFSMTVNFTLTVVLLIAIGFWGVPIATAVSMVLSCLWFIHATGPVTGIGAREWGRRILWWPVVAALPGALACFLVDMLMMPWDTRLPNLAAAGAAAIGFGIAYLLVLRRTSFLSRADLDILDNTLRLTRVPGYAAWSRSLRRRTQEDPA